MISEVDAAKQPFSHNSMHQNVIDFLEYQYKIFQYITVHSTTDRRKRPRFGDAAQKQYPTPCQTLRPLIFSPREAEAAACLTLVAVVPRASFPSLTRSCGPLVTSSRSNLRVLWMLCHRDLLRGEIIAAHTNNVKVKKVQVSKSARKWEPEVQHFLTPASTANSQDVGMLTRDAMWIKKTMQS